MQFLTPPPASSHFFMDGNGIRTWNLNIFRLQFHYKVLSHSNRLIKQKEKECLAQTIDHKMFFSLSAYYPYVPIMVSAYLFQMK
jgi:hypothetical protein